MATSDKEQMSELVPMHKRLAMGVKLDGTTLKAKGSEGNKTSKPTGGLASLKKQK
jgi:hypothetical protein